MGDHCLPLTAHPASQAETAPVGWWVSQGHRSLLCGPLEDTTVCKMHAGPSATQLQRCVKGVGLSPKKSLLTEGLGSQRPFANPCFTKASRCLWKDLSWIGTGSRADQLCSRPPQVP